ncbi:hypothetical protein JTE90_022622 [Oedothorax gibbosus]|uniref:Uncharacterized protein n=1 Tax=Oedothorax gibbosus TaxID=931172 RepID=A0AAV6TU28_9ARAC|nr:hypothetical protein JTE90_022622 [Oedothorax gibbosus]
MNEPSISRSPSPSRGRSASPVIRPRRRVRRISSDSSDRSRSPVRRSVVSPARSDTSSIRPRKKRVQRLRSESSGRRSPSPGPAKKTKGSSRRSRSLSPARRRNASISPSRSSSPRRRTSRSASPQRSPYLKWGKTNGRRDKNILVYRYPPHRLRFVSDGEPFKTRRVGNKQCRLLLSHCSKQHPTKRDTRPRKTTIYIRKRR